MLNICCEKGMKSCAGLQPPAVWAGPVSGSGGPTLSRSGPSGPAGVAPPLPGPG